MAFNIPDYYQRLAGTVFVGDRHPATGTLDNSKGLFFLGDTSELTLDPSQEFVEHSEHQSGDGRRDVKIPRMTEIKGNLVIDNTGAHNFRDFLRSKLTVIAGDTVTAEPHTAPAAGKSFLIDSEFVVSVASITNAAGTVTYQAGTDYLINGRVVRVPLGSTLAETAIAINYVSGSGVEADLFGESFQEFYLYFNGKNTINGDTITLELFKVSFDPATLGNLLGDEILQMTVPFDALWEPLQDTDENGDRLGGFGSITRTYRGIDLFTSLDAVQNGDTFTITFITSTPGIYPYTITGVNSADIGGASLTGTFTASGEARTFTMANDVNKTFNLTLNNNQASVSVTFTQIVQSLSASPSSVGVGVPFTITFSSNISGSFGYTITGVTSEDISGASLTGTFSNNGDSITLVSSQTESKTITISLNNGNGSVSVAMNTPLFLIQGTMTGIVYNNTNNGIISSTLESFSSTIPGPILSIAVIDSGGGVRRFSDLLQASTGNIASPVLRQVFNFSRNLSSIENTRGEDWVWTVTPV